MNPFVTDPVGGASFERRVMRIKINSAYTILSQRVPFISAAALCERGASEVFAKRAFRLRRNSVQ